MKIHCTLFRISWFLVICLCHSSTSRLLWWWKPLHGLGNASEIDEDEYTYWILNRIWRRFCRTVTFSIIELLCSSAQNPLSLVNSRRETKASQMKIDEGRVKEKRWKFTLYYDMEEIKIFVIFQTQEIKEKREFFNEDFFFLSYFLYFRANIVALMRMSAFVDFIFQHCIQFETQRIRSKREIRKTETFPFNNVFN